MPTRAIRRRDRFPAFLRRHLTQLYHESSLNNAILGAISVTQASLILVLGFVLTFSLNSKRFSSTLGNGNYELSHLLQKPGKEANAPDIHELLQVVAGALESQDVTYWLLPGLELLPPSRKDLAGSPFGRLSPWHEGVDIGVFHGDLMRVILIQTDLQPYGIMAVESYFGLRLFLANGVEDPRYDFRRPFIDIVYFKREGNNIVSHCCDCEPSVIGACSKKTCDCLVCVAPVDDIFPTMHITIERVNLKLRAPRLTEFLRMQDRSNSLHPMLGKLLDGRE